MSEPFPRFLGVHGKAFNTDIVPRHTHNNVGQQYGELAFGWGRFVVGRIGQRSRCRRAKDESEYSHSAIVDLRQQPILERAPDGWDEPVGNVATLKVSLFFAGKFQY